MLQVQAPTVQFLFFPDLFPTLLHLSTRLNSEMIKITPRFQRTSRNLTSISSGLSTTSSVCESTAISVDLSPKPNIIGDQTDLLPRPRGLSALNSRPSRSVPNPPPFFPLQRDSLSPTIAALDGPRPLGLNAAFSVGTFSMWIISRLPIPACHKGGSSNRNSTIDLAEHSHSKTTSHAFLYSSQISCKVHSENLKAKKIFGISGHSYDQSQSSFLEGLEAYLLCCCPLPSLRLDLEITNGVVLTGELDASYILRSSKLSTPKQESHEHENDSIQRSICSSSQLHCIAVGNGMELSKWKSPSSVETLCTDLMVISAPALGSLVTTALSTIALPLQYLRTFDPRTDTPQISNQKLNPNEVKLNSVEVKLPSFERHPLYSNFLSSESIDPSNTQTDCQHFIVHPTPLIDQSMHSLVEAPVELAIICSSRPKTGQDDRRSGEVKLDTYCSSIALQICQSDLVVLSSIVNDFIESSSSSCDDLTTPIITTPAESQAQPDVILEWPTKETDQHPESLLSFEADTERTSRHDSHHWTLLWRFTTECDGFQLTLASWPFVMPLARLRIGSVGLQLTRRALAADGTSFSLQIAQVSHPLNGIKFGHKNTIEHRRNWSIFCVVLYI